MKIKGEGARVVHAPLSFAFSMIEEGGSNIQKYDTISLSFTPNRVITPYVLRPQLMVTDPDELLVSGDYAQQMSVNWTLKLYKNHKISNTLASGTDYVFDTKTKKLTIKRNTTIDETISVDFVGTFRNPNSGDVSSFKWHKNLSTLAETAMNINIELRCPPKLDFSVFKNYGQFPIEAVLRNGETDLTAEQTGWKWQTLDDTGKKWIDIVPDDCPWYVSGKDTSTIIVDSDYVQRVPLLVTGWPTADNTQTASASTLVRRFYGQWYDEPEYTYSAYILKDTKTAEAHVKITRRNGDVTEPFKYFDIEMFYRADENSKWESRGNTDSFTMTKDELTGKQRAGEITRELSAFMPIGLPDGKILCDEKGKPICARFPTSSKEYD